MSNEKTYRRRFEEQVIASSRLSDKCIELQAENTQLKQEVVGLTALVVSAAEGKIKLSKP